MAMVEILDSGQERRQLLGRLGVRIGAGVEQNADIGEEPARCRDEQRRSARTVARADRRTGVDEKPDGVGMERGCSDMKRASCLVAFLRSTSGSSSMDFTSL